MIKVPIRMVYCWIPAIFIGTLFLIAINLVTGTGLFLSGHQIATIPWWAYIGGITGTIRNVKFYGNRMDMLRHLLEYLSEEKGSSNL